MKFLLFNAAVIAALVYLFGVDRSDLDAASDHLQTSADRIEEAARDKVDAALDGLRKNPAPLAAPAPSNAEEPAALVRVTEDLETAPEERNQQAIETVPASKADPAAKLEAVDSNFPNNGIAAIVDNERPAAEPLPAVRDPAVAKRRAEVLGGVASAGGAPSVALAEGEQLMSPEQRVRELHALAEEMELLFVDKMAR